MIGRVTAAALLACAIALADEAPRFAPAPGEESPETAARIDEVAAALGAGRTVAEILTDASYLSVRAWPRFRALVRDHAPVGSVALAPSAEPGRPLRVRGTVRDAAGRPVGDALLYVYQTSAKGWYSDLAPHISGNSGDRRYARLFAYLRTDSEGRYELHTIRPAGYPGSDLPAHIHVEITPPGSTTAARVTEILFDDDPRLTPEWRRRSTAEGGVIAPVPSGSESTFEIVADFSLR